MKKRPKKSSREQPILVIGDLIIDVHHFGELGGTSTEAPVPLGFHTESRLGWGGAGLVVRNLLALGKNVTFISVLGDDEFAHKAREFEHRLLKKIFFTERRATMVKERFIVDGAKVLRWNRGDSKPINPKTSREIVTCIKKNIPNFGKILISDYRHGLMTTKLAREIIALATKSNTPVFVDSQIVRGENNHRWYEGAHLFCVNEKEATNISPTFNADELETSTEQLKSLLKTSAVVVKLGARGSATILEDEYFETPTLRVQAVDPVGAGDAFFAALASQGVLSKDAVAYANRWASLATTIEGTEPPTLKMLRQLA